MQEPIKDLPSYLDFDDLSPFRDPSTVLDKMPPYPRYILTKMVTQSERMLPHAEKRYLIAQGFIKKLDKNKYELTALGRYICTLIKKDLNSKKGRKKHIKTKRHLPKLW